MKCRLFVIMLGLLSSACVHRWVGRPVAQLEREYGSPRNVQGQGENQIYYYPDLLAGRGEMTFTVDRNGIIRSWCATASVPGPWQDDIFGNPVDGPSFGNAINNNGINGGVGSRVGNLPQGLPAGTCR